MNKDLQACESKNLLFLGPFWMSRLHTTEGDPLLLEFMKSFIYSLSKYLLSPCYMPDTASGLGDPVGNRGESPSYGAHTELGVA